jgi:hypothetical protein
VAVLIRLRLRIRSWLQHRARETGSRLTVLPTSFYTIIANSVLDPDESRRRTSSGSNNSQRSPTLTHPLVASDFIPRLDNFRVPDYYKSFIHTTRVHHDSGKDPRLELAAKPRGGYGWNPRSECCAQQTGMHKLVVEALLIAIYSTWDWTNTYTHRKILSVENLSRANS